MDKKNYRTIIILSSPRSGSKLLYDALKKFSCESEHLFNLNFWGLALKAIKGDDTLFKDRIKQKFSYIKIPELIDKDVVYDIWTQILVNDGSLLIDKSPFYLDDFEILELILDYKKNGNNVDFISCVRHPLDSITSQEENGKYRLGYFSIEERESLYIKRFENLKKIMMLLKDIPQFRYEDFIVDYKGNITKLFKKLKINFTTEDIEESAMIIGKSGRYNLSCNIRVRRWAISDKLKEIVRNNRYAEKPLLHTKDIISIITKSLLNEFRAIYFTFRFKILKRKS